jgi:Putative glucoamylase
MASYLGIAAGQIPAKHYWGPVRTFYNDNCDYSWTETKPVGGWQTYDGIPVFEGAQPYRDVNVVPTWGGSMFEALMVPLLVPEEQWGPRSWGVNHPLYVRAQIEHGLKEAKYGYWGFSPSNNPDGGYREYGVDPIGMEPNGYTSDQERTTVDYGFSDPSGVGYCPGREPKPLPASYGRGVVTPHASFLALRYAPDAALDNLANLKRDFAAYGWGGFYDAVEVKTGTVSNYYLALDQGMVMAALGNALRNDRLRAYFSQGAIEKAIRPLLQSEEFTAGQS